MAMATDGSFSPTETNDERPSLLNGEFPLAISFIDLDSLTFAATSKFFVEQTGLPVEDVLYRPVSVFIAPNDRRKMINALKQLGEHNVEFYATKRELDARIIAENGSFMWARVWRFEIKDRNFAFCEMNIGPEPKSFRFSENFEYSLHNLVVGLIDGDGIVTSVSPQVHDVLGISAEELVGHQLFNASEEQQIRSLVAEENNGELTYSVALRMGRRDTRTTELEPLCVLTALAETTDRCFIISPTAVFLNTQRSQRTSQLELHLVRIAQEIQASRVLDSFDQLTPNARFPQLGTLNPRQWEVLRRLFRGERVASIAAALFLSPSAIRNTLSEIFQKFGVHSQVELLDLLSNSDISQPQ